MLLKQYDVVRVIGIKSNQILQPDSNRRAPRIGDVATILEIYSEPFGYELECSDQNGITEWLGGFGPDEMDLELVNV